MRLDRRHVSDMDAGPARRQTVSGSVLYRKDYNGGCHMVPLVSASHDGGRRHKINGIDDRISGICSRCSCRTVWIFHWSRSGFSEIACMQESASASKVFFGLYQAFIPHNKAPVLL